MPGDRRRAERLRIRALTCPELNRGAGCAFYREPAMPEPTEEEIREITNAIIEGRKIEAIKRYREISGVGLREAKEFIETLTAKLRKSHPQKFESSPAPKTGCLPVVIVVLLLAASVPIAFWLGS